MSSIESPQAAQPAGDPSPQQVCRLVDAMVKGKRDDDQVVRGLMVIEIWCKHLRELIRDAGRRHAVAVIDANRYVEDQVEDRGEQPD